MTDTDHCFNRTAHHREHNIHETRPGPLFPQLDTLVSATLFNVGIRAFDIAARR